MHRYFYAVTPPEPLRERIESFRVRWGSPHHRVEPHITVKAPFLWQEAPDRFIGAVQSALEQVPPFPVQLGTTARFGGTVLYLTVAAPNLLDLHLRVIDVLEPWAKVAPHGHEGERYTPHLTLAAGRFGIDPERLAAMERAAQAELGNLPQFTASALRLYQKRPADRTWQSLRDLPLGSLV